MVQPQFARALQSFASFQPTQQCLRNSRGFAGAYSKTSRVVSAGARSAVQGRRWYSDAGAKQEEAAKEGESAGTKGGEAKEEAAVSEDAKKLEKKNAEVIDLTDRLKRSVADFANLQHQTKREVQAAKDFALQKFAKDLIDSIDNLDRALGTVPQEKLTEENKELMSLHSGLTMTEKILMQTLAKHGMERFDPSEAGDRFDPNKHEATFQVPQPDKEDGTVFHTQQKGFSLNGRILRAAKVGVVKNS